MDSPLDAFLPAVQAWFREAFGQPTPPQVMGWPAIQRGEHTLILSPTGSGKTLAAFLWGIDELYREIAEAGQGYQEGVRLLYISPLKALNNDIERNLRVPLAGIRRVAKEQGNPLPVLEVMVRTGDTPQSARQQMAKHPPHILITTPESLYLILTSPVARDMFRTVRTVIVDEIHTLVGNKRGVHLALSLERAEELAEGPVQRIGLSATQRPLDEVARFLGGYEPQFPEPGNQGIGSATGDGSRCRHGQASGPAGGHGGGGFQPVARREHLASGYPPGDGPDRGPPHHAHFRQQPPPGRARC
jgi:ATP-dependent Lhr-like helicase